MRVALTNFTGGEISRTLSARYDLARYRTSSLVMENFFPNLHGAATRRPGTIFLGQLDAPSVVLPFRFSTEAFQNYVLVLSDKALRVADEDGLLPLAADQTQIATPYAFADLLDISYAQVGDVVYLAHNSYPLHKVTRSGSGPHFTWTVHKVALNASLPAPAAPSASFSGGGEGYTLRYKVVAVDENGKESLPSPAGEVDGKHPSDWVVGNSASLSWQAVPGAVEYNVYREEAGYFGFIGVCSAADASSGTVSGIKVGDMSGTLMKFSGSITRTVVNANGNQDVESSDSTSPLSVTANTAQNAFSFDGKLVLWVTKTTKVSTWERKLDNEGNTYWTENVSISSEHFWAMVHPQNINAPAGSYASHTLGKLGNSAAAPSGTISVYTLVPVYTGASTLSFVDNNYEADITDTPREDWDPFKDNNHPGVVAFHQQRMVLANTPTSPQAFYMSRVGDFENFRKSRPLQDDDPVEYSIASGSIDSITWAASFGDLLLGTSGSEYKASGDGQAITVKNITITAQSYWGSARLRPIIIGNSVMHVQRHSVRVRDLFYSLEKDGYAGNDLSIMAPHLFEGHTLKQWAYQQMPWSNIWVVRDDGVLLCMTYMKEHDIWGWSRHVTDGKVCSVCSVSSYGEDALLLVVERGGKYMLERLAPEWTEQDGVQQAFFVDCGLSVNSTDGAAQSAVQSTVNGLGHLEGREVAVLADGSPVEGLTVKDGSITLPYAASVVHVGLPYVSTLVPLPMEGDTQTGTTLGRKRGLGQCVVRVHASVGGMYGPNQDQLFDFPFVPARWGEAVELFSGDMQFTPGGGQDEQSTLCLVQDRPLPFTVTGLVMDVDVAQN